MMTIISGVGLLLLTLAVFSIFSLKFPKGSQAMSGMANAAVASFLIEAVHKYITGDLLGIAFLGEVGATAGSLGGVAAGIMVPLSMGVNPVFAVVGGLAGLAAAMLGIVNNAPGTASPIPGLIAPFGFNPAGKVILALALAAVGGLLAGYVGGTVFSRLEKRKKATAKAAEPAVYGDPLADDEMLEA